MEQAILQFTVLFTLVLALALVVERVLEVLKAAYDLMDSRFDYCRFWTHRAHRTAALLERRLRVFEYVDPGAAAGVLRRFDEMLLREQSARVRTTPVLSGDLVRAVWVRFGSKLIGAVLGILAALLLDLDLLAVLRESPITTLGQLLTGVAIGLGAGPVHKVITAIERQRKRRATREAAHA